MERIQKIGFLQKIEHAYEEMKDDLGYSTKAGEHVLITGSTGSGKSRLLLRILEHKVCLDEGICLVDEKNVLHREIKHIFKEQISRQEKKLYQLGSPGYGSNDIRINILDLACSSKKKSKAFFEKIISEKYKTDGGSHLFWAEGAYKMAYDTYRFISTIQKILFFIASRTKNEENLIFEYAAEIDLPEKDDKEWVKAYFTSSPLTFKDLNMFFIDYDQFKLISSFSKSIADKLIKECKYKHKYVLKDLSKKEASTIDSFLYELRIAGENLSRYQLNSDRTEFSGNNGLWFTLQSSIPSALVENEMINEPYPTHDMIEILESKDILIIDSESLEGSIVNIVMNTLWDVLSLRSSKNKTTPVSFMIEEASRVLSNDVDLERTLAYARESKLSITLVTQSISQLTHIFGDIQTDSILNNLKIMELNEKDSSLPEFSFTVRKSGRTHSFEPNFTTMQEIYFAEHIFQKDTGQYILVDIEENEIVLFDQRLHELKGTVRVVDIGTMEEREGEYDISRKSHHGYFMEEYQRTEDVIDIKEFDSLFDELMKEEAEQKILDQQAENPFYINK